MPIWLEVFLFMYGMFNAVLSLAMFATMMNEREFSIYPSLIYSLRNNYRINTLGTIIVITLVTLLCLPAIIISTTWMIVSFAIFCLCTSFCYLFQRRH